MTKKEIAFKMALAHAQIEYADRLKNGKIEQEGTIPLDVFCDLVKHDYGFFYSLCDLDIDKWAINYKASGSSFKSKQMDNVSVEANREEWDITLSQKVNDMTTEYVVINPEQADLLIKWLEEAKDELLNGEQDE